MECFAESSGIFIQEKVDLSAKKEHKGSNFYTGTQSELNGHFLLRFIWLSICLVHYGMNAAVSNGRFIIPYSVTPHVTLPA